QIGRRREAHEETSCPGTYRLQVGDVDSDRLASDVSSLGPITPEMHSLNEHIYRRRHRIFDGEHGRIVARTDPNVAGQRQSFGDRCNKREFAYFSQRGVTPDIHPISLYVGYSRFRSTL